MKNYIGIIIDTKTGEVLFIKNECIDDMEINKATAIYSGGGIYLFYAELKNKNWLMGNDEWLVVVNTNPLADEQTFEDSQYYEWQREHLMQVIAENEHGKVLKNILEVIFNGNTIKEYNNFSIQELKYIYSEVK